MRKPCRPPGFLNPSVRELLISLPDPDNDPKALGSYRPLALLNTDYKILEKLLADLLLALVPALVHADQNGFVPARNTSPNLRQFFLILPS
ncbi:hypothetical protein NDU88_002228 [Pleurodeles waltl]|uniref:Reverse transcriptase domain-containing protein n=1 Tax=Pleurodeles waltl TaxID=8319 RepID=A0AAV7UUZ4_PLEWA|nr:hypothetical protein NDU88_002228 [Pleurodeles waltl]